MPDAARRSSRAGSSVATDALLDDAAAAKDLRARWPISRGQLFMLLAVLLPAVASMLAPVFSEDVAYHVRAGQLMLERGTLINTDPFTFTVGGRAWLNQQWGASIALAGGFELTGWAGLVVMRAVLIGITFGLVYAACRGVGATSVVSSLVTLGAFEVAATNLALRSEMFGLLCFAAVVAILVYRRKHPWWLWALPIVMLVWANTHGSFFIGWAAIAFAVIEDLAARSRLAIVTIVAGAASILVTLINPWGMAVWGYVVDLSTNPLISMLVTEWQATTLKSPTGLFFFGSAAFVGLVLLLRGRVLSWLQLAWLAVLAVVGLTAERGVAWWAIGAAPLVAILVSGLVIRGRSLADPKPEQRRTIGYTAIAAILAAFALTALPFWRPIDALYGPESLLRDAPRGVTEMLRAATTPADRLYADQRWSSWFEMAVPGVPVMVDSRIELFNRGIWSDYLHVSAARTDWQQILDRWNVTVIATAAGADSQIVPFLDASDVWSPIYRDDEGVVYRRVPASS